MNISAITLTYLSAIFWILPAIRQYKTSLFRYFLVLAISDLLGLIFYYYLKIEFSYFYIIVSFCLYVSLQQFKYIERKKILFFGGGSLILALSFIKLGTTFDLSILTILHLMIIFRILYLFVMKVAQKQTINFFYLVLAFYEFTIILKFLNFLIELKVEAETYFYITTGFELLVGIFFTTFREESTRLVYKLK